MTSIWYVSDSNVCQEPRWDPSTAISIFSIYFPADCFSGCNDGMMASLSPLPGRFITQAAIRRFYRFLGHGKFPSFFIIKVLTARIEPGGPTCLLKAPCPAYDANIVETKINVHCCLNDKPCVKPVINNQLGSPLVCIFRSHATRFVRGCEQLIVLVLSILITTCSQSGQGEITLTAIPFSFLISVQCTRSASSPKRAPRTPCDMWPWPVTKRVNGGWWYACYACWIKTHQHSTPQSAYEVRGTRQSELVTTRLTLIQCLLDKARQHVCVRSVQS